VVAWPTIGQVAERYSIHDAGAGLRTVLGSDSKASLLAAIDAGGTTFKLGVAGLDGHLLGQTRVPTTTPDATIRKTAEHLLRLAEERGADIVRLGIGSFGPVVVDPLASDYGKLLKTPKANWSGVPLLSLLKDRLGVPAVLDTDVNAALLAEMRIGAATGLSSAAYITVGTGLGVGVGTLSGFAARPLHPELGHIRVERHPSDLAFKGACSVHGDCLEGLASGPALSARFGSLEALPESHEAWRLAGFYLAQLCAVIAMGFRVQKIVLGGGVAEAPSLLQQVQRCTADVLKGYLPEASDPTDFIVRAGLGSNAGLLGAIELARMPSPDAKTEIALS
jgi:fructokinase